MKFFSDGYDTLACEHFEELVQYWLNEDLALDREEIEADWEEVSPETIMWCCLLEDIDWNRMKEDPAYKYETEATYKKTLQEAFDLGFGSILRKESNVIFMCSIEY